MYPTKALGRNDNWVLDFEFDLITGHEDRDGERWYQIWWTNLHNMGFTWTPGYQISGHMIVREYEQRVTCMESTKFLAGLQSSTEIAIETEGVAQHISRMLNEPTVASFPYFEALKPQEQTTGTNENKPYVEQVERNVHFFCKIIVQ